MPKGIYTLANDNLYDQVIALVNSIRRNYDRQIPICIIPYDDKVNKLKSLNLEQVCLFENEDSIKKWQIFASEVWSHECFSDRKKTAWYHNSSTIRKLCSFDGPFDKFIYIDSDALVMSSLEDCFNKLTEYDCVFDDWEHNKEQTFLSLDLINQKYQFSEKDVRRHCHSSDFFASKSTLINAQLLDELKFNLLKDEEIRFINNRGWWDEVYLFSYITFKLNCKVFNYTLSIDPNDRTGNIAGVDPFVDKDHILFNKEGLKSIHRIHYMGYKSELFKRLCEGEDTNIPHQETFLYYRFMNEPDKLPTHLKKANFLVMMSRFLQKAFSKISEILQQN
jgi:hypothetical protein